MSTSNDDCYFYYYSTCTKGDTCPFRHCEAALGTETVCLLWKEGKCSRGAQCKFRHMESNIKRSAIPCWFETQPTGCRKPHCVFMHKKPRNLQETQEQSDGLILPVSTQTPNEEPKSQDDQTSANAKFKLYDDTSLYQEAFEQPNSLCTTTQNIEPISISINDPEEESDDEQHPTQALTKADPKADFGIKTLEQIRMEKIFQESNELMPSEVIKSSEIESPKAIKSNPVSPKQRRFPMRDARIKLKRKSLNDNNDNSSSSNDTKEFEVKTLEQIRREKEAKNSEANNPDLIHEAKFSEVKNPGAKNPKTNLNQNPDVKNPDANQRPEDQLQRQQRVHKRPCDAQGKAIKIRRTCLAPITTQQSQQQLQHQDVDEDKITSTSSFIQESKSDSNEVSSSDDAKVQSSSIDTIKSIEDQFDDLDYFLNDDLPAGQTVNLNVNISNNDDDELMREIDQVING